MTCDRRLLLLLALLAAFGLLAAEGRARQHEEADARHRHRHRHDASPGRRTRHEPGDVRTPWSADCDHERESAPVKLDDGNESDDEDEEDEDYEDEDYDAESYYDRTRARGRGYRGRFDARHQHRYHRAGYHGARYDAEIERRRSPSSRYASRSHRPRPGRTHHRAAYGRELDEYDFDDDEEGYDYDRNRGYEDAGHEERYPTWRRSSRRRGTWRRFSRGRQAAYDRPGGRRVGYHDDRGDDLDEDADRSGSRRSKTDDWRRRENSSADSKIPVSRSDRKKEKAEEAAKEEQDELDERVDRLDDKKDDEEEDDIWKEIGDNFDNEEDELDNDFYKSEDNPALKTFDDIIRRLTADEPTTPRNTVKRDYRNIEVEKYARPSVYANFGFDSKNASRSVGYDRSRASIGPYVAGLGSRTSKRPAEKLATKSTSESAERKASRSAPGVAVKAGEHSDRKPSAKLESGQARTKSLEPDYDEYLNAGENEKEEDLIKAAAEDESGMQADVTSTDYTDDESTDEDETPVDASATSTSTTSTTTSTTSTTTTTTTPRPAVTQHFDYRDPRAYDAATGSQYNGYQSKGDYPPMSAHSVHKWQSLGTREGVKETRSNVPQYNKNGKTAEIKEALQHAIKVSREGSCQWPRARVIPVRDVYPSPSTTYIPHCAILHRCSDDTGCCRSEALTCVPKHSHRVELSFYTTSVGGPNVVEKLSFYNHTECECKERSQIDTTNERPAEQRFYRHHPQPPPQQPLNMRRPPPRKPCRCPSEFTPRITPEGECQCNCYENDENCVKTKRGKGYFSLADRLCIQNDECATPSCEFGEYMRRQGKCPRKRDKFDAIANYHTSLSHRYRS